MNLSFFKKHKVVSSLLVLILILATTVAVYPLYLRTGIPKERNYPSYIKGVTVVNFLLAQDIKQMKNDNINFVSLYPAVHLNIPSQETLYLRFVKKAKKNGIAINLAPAIFAPDPPDPKSVDDEKLARYTDGILDWAKFAEKYGVEYFTPMGEVDFALCTDRALAWLEQVLPEIRKVYSGKIFTQYAGNHMDCRPEGKWLSDEEEVEYWVKMVRESKDFDGVLLDIFAPMQKEQFEDFYSTLEKTVKLTSVEAKKLDLEIAIGEFGIATEKSKHSEGLTPGPIVSVEEQLEFTEKYLDIVMPHYDGVIYGAWATTDYGMKDKPVEKIIRERFE